MSQLEDDIKQLPKIIDSLMKAVEGKVKDLKEMNPEEAEKVNEQMPEIEAKIKEVKEDIEKQKERYARLFRES